MKSLKLIMLAALVLTVAGLGQAATIALVSDATAPGDRSDPRSDSVGLRGDGQSTTYNAFFIAMADGQAGLVRTTMLALQRRSVGNLRVTN